jgi:hypothetical protein
MLYIFVMPSLLCLRLKLRDGLIFSDREELAGYAEETSLEFIYNSNRHD